MGEGLGFFLDRTSVGDQEKVTSRVAGGGVGVGAEEEAEWIQENRVEESGKMNVTGTIDGSIVASKNP